MSEEELEYTDYLKKTVHEQRGQINQLQAELSRLRAQLGQQQEADYAGKETQPTPIAA